MNIAFVNWWTFNTVMGGIEAVGARVARALIARGHKVCFATVEEGYPSVEGVPYLLFPNKRHPRSKVNRESLVNYFRQQGVEVIVCHNAYSHRLAVLMHEVAVRLGVPLLFEIHTTPNAFETEAHRPKIIRPIERWYREKKTLRQWRLIHRVGDRIILLSERYIPIYCELIGLKSNEKIISIPNPNTYLSSEVPEKMEKANVVLYVGRFEWRVKRLYLLLQAWGMLESHYPDWSLQIVGGGSDEERTELDLLIDTLGIQRVSFEGVQKPREYLEKAKILSLTSKYEGWGLVLTEAMQFGVVPVAIDSYAALGEILDEGRAGRMVASDDPKDFAEALSSLMSDEEMRQSIASHAQEYVKRFDLDVVTDRWEALLHEIIKEKNG